MQKLNNDANELIYKTESQIQKTNLRLPKRIAGVGKEGGKFGVWDKHIHTTIYKTDNNKNTTQGTIFNTL